MLGPGYTIKRTFLSQQENVINLFFKSEKVDTLSLNIIHPHLSYFFNFFNEAIKNSVHPEITLQEMYHNDWCIILTCNFDRVNQFNSKGFWSFSFESRIEYTVFLDYIVYFLKKTAFINYEFLQFTNTDIIFELCTYFHLDCKEIKDVAEYAGLDRDKIFITVKFKNDEVYSITVSRKEKKALSYDRLDNIIIEVISSC